MNSDGTPNNCVADDEGFYFRSEVSPHIEGCSDDPDGGYVCMINEFSRFASNQLKYPIEALREGYQETIVVQLRISETGTIESYRNIRKNRPIYPFGVQEEVERLMGLIKEEYSIIPAECDKQKVKSSANLFIKLKIPEDQMGQVIEKSIATEGTAHQVLNIVGINSQGKLSFEYRTNLNTPSRFEIYDSEGRLIKEITPEYFYKRYRDYTDLPNKVNGVYTVKAIQDGSEVVSKMECTIYKQNFVLFG